MPTSLGWLTAWDGSAVIIPKVWISLVVFDAVNTSLHIWLGCKSLTRAHLRKDSGT
jgi:hypothetical protein